MSRAEKGLQNAKAVQLSLGVGFTEGPSRAHCLLSGQILCLWSEAWGSKGEDVKLNETSLNRVSSTAKP
jgi:hypothetical protein